MAKSIVAVGTANTEQILAVNKIESGKKSESKFVTANIGGSAVNWAFRLRYTLDKKSVNNIYVFCPLGGDERGELIRKQLETAGITVYPQLPLADKFTTNHSFILVCGDERTVFTQRGTAVEKWALDLSDNISTEITRDSEVIAMIGNIPKVKDDKGDAAVITEQVIRALSEKNLKYLYVNFGRAQYTLCYHHWKEVWGTIDCFQLNTEEARDFLYESCRCAECR